MRFPVFVALSIALSVSAAPTRRDTGFALQNGEDAIALKWVACPFTVIPAC